MQKSTRCVTIPSEAVETICQDDNAVKLSSVVCWLIVVSAAVSVLLSPSRFASQSIEWAASNDDVRKGIAPTNKAVWQAK